PARVLRGRRRHGRQPVPREGEEPLLHRHERLPHPGEGDDDRGHNRLDWVVGRCPGRDRQIAMDLTYDLLSAVLAGMPHWRVVLLSAAIPGVLLITFMAVGPIIYVYAERKIAGFMQDRLGPMRVGPYGVLQTVADAIKLMFKEAIFPAGVDKLLFLLAP